VFSARALSEGLRAIYDEKIDVRTEIERHIFEETLRLFNEATAQGLSDSIDPDLITDRFLQELRTNNAVFSAFRTHRMQNDIARQLIDPLTGQLKSFDRWKLDIKGMTDHYVHSWLQTEYDTAVIRAHQAADWKHFIEEADVLPNVRWMPTTSITPDPVHEHYWTKKLTLPVDHPFWQEHRPGERWNCKCSLQQTDDPVNASALDGWTPPLPQPGLDNNPAKDGQLFSDTHPYYTEAYPGAQQAVNNLMRKQSPSSLRRTEEDKARILKEWEDRKVLRENDKELADRLGVSTPQLEMSFDAANQRRVNPKYFESDSLRTADIIARTTNCQTCVVAYEMRRRGFNVEAMVRKKRVDFAWDLSKKPYIAFKPVGVGYDPVYQFGARPETCETVKDFVAAKKTPGRYHIYWDWKGECGNGHIITFELTRDGTAFFYDPQIAERMTAEEFIRIHNSEILEGSVRYYRVDNLPIHSYATDIVKLSKK